MVHNLACNEQTHLQVSLLFCLPYKRKGVYMTRKKMLLFTLVISMGTVWRLLELLEYGEIEVRQVDTYMYLYMLATCFVAFLVGKESATTKAAKSKKCCKGLCLNSKIKPLKNNEGVYYDYCSRV